MANRLSVIKMLNKLFVKWFLVIYDRVIVSEIMTILLTKSTTNDNKWKTKFDQN